MTSVVRAFMTTATRATILVVLVAAGAACGPKHVRQDGPGSTSQVVLLPDPDSGTTGSAAVSNGSGTVDLNSPRAATKVSSGQAPGAVTILSETEVQDTFGPALAALPPAPIHFTLFYKFDSDELTDESSALVPQILETVKQRASPDVVVTGHTDTIGTAASNAALGMRRAVAVRTLLVEAGLDPAFVEVTSHGEADLLVSTADNVAEPRNRRVEITVR
jgi:outer membrane protein OmpA-like peptidoglycan-associated protein